MSDLCGGFVPTSSMLRNEQCATPSPAALGLLVRSTFG